MDPLLFIVYLNDMLYDFEQGVYAACFADNTSFIVRSKTDVGAEASVARVQTALVDWFHVNCLSVNIVKI